MLSPTVRLYSTKKYTNFNTHNHNIAIPTPFGAHTPSSGSVAVERHPDSLRSQGSDATVVLYLVHFFVLLDKDG